MSLPRSYIPCHIYTGSSFPSLVVNELILKYPTNTGTTEETLDAKLSLSTTDFKEQQNNGSGYDDILITSLPLP